MLSTSIFSPASAYAQMARLALEQQHYEYAALLLRMCSQPASLAPWSYGVGLHAGLWRKRNEDVPCAVFHGPLGLWIIADGMGGHEDGQEAAMLAVQSLVDFLVGCSESLVTSEAIRELLGEGIQHANQAVYQRNQERAPSESASDGRIRMGTTLTMALCVGEQALIANVGDSRTYLLRDRLMYQITQDHSTVARLVADKLLKPDAFYTHPRRNEIYRSLGHAPTVEVDFFGLTLQPGDTLLLCSDGLWEMIPQSAAIASVLAAPLTCAEQAQQLVQLALQGGGKDNVSCVVARYVPPPALSPIVDAPTLALPRRVS